MAGAGDGDEIKILETKVVILGNTGASALEGGTQRVECQLAQLTFCASLLLHLASPVPRFSLHGLAGVGKTSIVTKYVNNQFSPLTPATIGASFNIKAVYVF